MIGRTAFAVLVASFAALAFAGCERTPNAPELMGRWKLLRLKGRPIDIRSEIILRFLAGGHFGGTGGVNNHGGEYAYRNGTITLRIMMRTRMGSLPELEQQEDAYEKVLERAAFVRMTGGRLLLLDPEHRGTAMFVRLPEDAKTAR